MTISYIFSGFGIIFMMAVLVRGKALTDNLGLSILGSLSLAIELNFRITFMYMCKFYADAYGHT